MKKCILALLLFVAALSGYGQGVGVGTSAPDGSAALQVSSSSQGVLTPRLTAAQRMGIVRPAAGLLVYQTDGTPGTHFGYQDGPGSTALFRGPLGLAVDLAGNIYVADAGNYRIRKIGTDGTVTTFAGNDQRIGIDGVGTAASFDDPTDIKIDLNGNLYVRTVFGLKKILLH